jgi:predicted glycoside hydrolase/deacetylase ChbG (UPF0249 family)
MHRRRSAADNDEPADAAKLAMTPSMSGLGSGGMVHGAVEDSRRRAICIAVDDFGLHDGINAAALSLAGAGRVHAIGCMVGGAAWPAGSASLRRLNAHRIDLGLHLDLTETPLQPWTARPLAALIRDGYIRRLGRAAVRAAIRAQLDAFEQAIGRGPAFVDGHQHVHQLPLVRSELLAELTARYGWNRPWLRSTRRARAREGLRPQGWRCAAKSWVIEQLGAAGLASAARDSGYAQNERLLGVYDFQGGPERYAERLAAWLALSRRGDLLMCHPSAATRQADPLIDARRAEFEVLSSAAFDALCSDAGIVLQPMSRILGAASRPA